MGRIYAILREWKLSLDTRRVWQLQRRPRHYSPISPAHGWALEISKTENLATNDWNKFRLFPDIGVMGSTHIKMDYLDYFYI